MFKELTPDELRVDSLYSIYKPKTPFRENRSRIYLDTFINGEVQKTSDSSFQKGLPAFCDCFTSGDSIFISTGAGFFGGFGIYISIEKTSFESSFYEYTDDVKPYKLSLSDTASTNFIHVKNSSQVLLLDKPPTFNSGDIVSGQLSFTSRPYFEDDNSLEMREVSVRGKIIFTCRLRAKTPFELWYFRQ